MLPSLTPARPSREAACQFLSGLMVAAESEMPSTGLSGMTTLMLAAIFKCHMISRRPHVPKDCSMRPLLALE